MTPVRDREDAGIEVAGRHERLAALPQDEEESGAALLRDDPLLLELILGADHVVDRVRDRGHVLERVPEGRILRSERLHLEREGVNRFLLVGNHALEVLHGRGEVVPQAVGDRKSTRLNSSHLVISYAVFCLKKKKKKLENMSRSRS